MIQRAALQRAPAAVVGPLTRGRLAPRILHIRQRATPLRLAGAGTAAAPANGRGILSQARWYSEAAGAAQQQKGDVGAAEGTVGSSSSTSASTSAAEGEQGKAGEGSEAEERFKRDLEAKNKEIAELKDKYLRSVADFRNLQERTRREVQSAKDFALQRFAKDFLDSVDNFDRALDSVPADKLTPSSSSSTSSLSSSSSAEPNKDLVALYSGLKMADGLLHSTLKKHGLERFDPIGEKFDAKLHDATFMAPQADKEDGTVFHVQQKGFLLNGRVLRAAKVGVVKNS